MSEKGKSYLFSLGEQSCSHIAVCLGLPAVLPDSSPPLLLLPLRGGIRCYPQWELSAITIQLFQAKLAFIIAGLTVELGHIRVWGACLKAVFLYWEA